MKKPPDGWPRISSAVFYDDAAKAIDWLCRVFGFEVRLKVEGEAGRIEHSELTFGDGLIMVGEAGGKSQRPNPLPCKSPRSLGGANTQALCVFVDDVDAHCERAPGSGCRDHRRSDHHRLRRGILERSQLSRARPGRSPVVVHAAGQRAEHRWRLTWKGR